MIPITEPRYPQTINRLETARNLSVALAVIAVSIAAVAALVFLPFVATAVGASVVGVGIYVCIAAGATVGVASAAAFTASIIAKIVAQHTVEVPPAYRARDLLVDGHGRSLARFPAHIPPAPAAAIDPVIDEERRRVAELERECAAIPDFGMFEPGSAAIPIAPGPLPLPANIRFPDELNPLTYVAPPEGCQCNENITCPITLEPFTNPYIILEEGITYEKENIRAALVRSPNRTPLDYENPVFNLVPNFALWEQNPVCPISQEPFRLPYICMETGYTFDLISLQSMDISLRHNVINFHGAVARQNENLVNSSTVTMYPNFALWPEDTAEMPAFSKTGLGPIEVVIR